MSTTNETQVTAEAVVIEWLEAQRKYIEARNPRLRHFSIEVSAKWSGKHEFCIFAQLGTRLCCGYGPTLADAEAALWVDADPETEAARLRARLAELEGKQ